MRFLYTAAIKSLHILKKINLLLIFIQLLYFTGNISNIKSGEERLSSALYRLVSGFMFGVSTVIFYLFSVFHPIFIKLKMCSRPQNRLYAMNKTLYPVLLQAVFFFSSSSWKGVTRNFCSLQLIHLGEVSMLFGVE